MKPDYKNWMPRGLLYTMFGSAALFGLLTVLVTWGPIPMSGTIKTVLAGVLSAATLFLCAVSCWMLWLYRMFSYTGKKQIARRIINGVADHVHIPDGGKGLDVGCGSGALTIACAKRNPNATMTGIDYWGLQYASFSQILCESNALAENTPNVVFQRGNARKLDFPDETFDIVTSNYVFHDIYGTSRQALVLETLRTLKKGGTFVIHDFMPHYLYGDLDAFAEKLRGMGYRDVQIIDTAHGKFITRWEALSLFLCHSTLLTGRK